MGSNPIVRAAYYAANREQQLARQAAYDAAHREEKRARNAAYRVANRDKLRAYDRARHAENPDRTKAAVARWKAAHPEGVRSHSTAQKARRRKAPGKFSAQEWLEVLEEFDHACAYCQARGVQLQKEHMMPLSRGGRHDRSNIVPACGSCNSRKGARTPLEFLAVQ